jgi:hypothetical protein
MSKQRYDVLVSRDSGKNDGKRYFTKIGAAFVNQDGSIGIKLDALPMGGDMLLKFPMEDNRQQGEQGQYQQQRQHGGQRPPGAGQRRGAYRPQGQPQPVNQGTFQQGVPQYPQSMDDAGFPPDDDEGPMT